MKFNEIEIYVNGNKEIALIQNGFAIAITPDQADLVTKEILRLKEEALLMDEEDE